MENSRDCLFCKIIQGEIPTPKVYEDHQFVCIKDIRPQAKTHLLVMPKEHISSLASGFSENEDGKSKVLGSLLEVSTKIARQVGLLPQGFRAVINTEKDAGQTVFHVHLHLLGGEPLSGSFG